MGVVFAALGLCVVEVSFFRHGGLHSFNLVVCFRALGCLTLVTLLILLCVCFFNGVLALGVCLRNVTVSALRSIELSELLPT